MRIAERLARVEAAALDLERRRFLATLRPAQALDLLCLLALGVIDAPEAELEQRKALPDPEWEAEAARLEREHPEITLAWRLASDDEVCRMMAAGLWDDYHAAPVPRLFGRPDSEERLLEFLRRELPDPELTAANAERRLNAFIQQAEAAAYQRGAAALTEAQP